MNYSVDDMNYNVAILKVTKSELLSAIQNNEFSFPERPKRLDKGDLILLSVHYTTREENEKPIKHKITFHSYECINKVVSGNKKRRSKYKIIGHNTRKLKISFDIYNFKVTDKKYRRAKTIVYVEEDDVREILMSGYLG